MFKSSLVALLVASSLVATAAKAEGMYVGVGYADLKMDTGCSAGSPCPFDGAKKGIADLRIGMEYNKYFAAEFRVSTSGKFSNSYREDFGGGFVRWGDTELKYDTSYGLFAKGMLPINDMVGLYGTAGIVRAKVTSQVTASSTDGIGGIRTSTSSDSETKTRLLFGAGVSITPVKNITVDLGYSQRGKFDGDLKYNAIDLGINYRF